jgi:hypothetical protein
MEKLLYLKSKPMARIDFINELRELGIDPKVEGTKVFFDYDIPVGRNIGRKVSLGFEVGDDYPMNCPPGPHFKSDDSHWIEPHNNVNPSPFGEGWRYWSRPFPKWNQTDRKARTYLAHIKNLLVQV